MKSRRVFSLVVLSFLVLSFTVAEARVPISQMPAPRAFSGNEAELLGPHPVTFTRPPVTPLDDPIGNVFEVGTTWTDLQHNASAGKMIGVDQAGYVHLSWTNGYDSGNIERHVSYNVWDPDLQMMLFDNGVQIDQATRGGFVSLAAVPTGWGFPIFHEIPSGASVPHTAGAMDFIPHAGSFTVTEPAYLNDLQLIWPKVTAGPDFVLHVVSTENTIPYNVYYSRGIPDYEGQNVILWEDVGAPGEQFLLMGQAEYVSADIAASQASNRLAIAWTDFTVGGSGSQYDQDIYYRTSDDGGLTWNGLINLTNFAAQDTHRAFADVSVLFDHADNLHIAFTTSYFNSGVGSTQSGCIWHWSEATDAITAVAIQWEEGTMQPGTMLRNVCRPSLAEDTTNGFLYCSYEMFNINSWSAGGYYNSDAGVAVSVDGGRRWSVGRNVTNTTPAQNPSPSGSCESERDITLASPISFTDGTAYLNLEWELDLDCGSAFFGEGTYTQNSMYYQRIPADSIPLLPLLPEYAFHYGDQIPPPDSGRCCYGSIVQPTCVMNILDECAILQGEWDTDLTCDTECPAVINCTCQTEPNTHCMQDTTAIPWGIMIPINVPVGYHITDLNVCLDISHPAMNELQITLLPPMVPAIPLYASQGQGHNFRCTVFDDQAAGPIGGGEAPYNGSFQPASPLSVVNGQIALGDWIVNVRDTVSGNPGTVNWICLNFSYDYIVGAEDVPGVPVEYSLAAYPNPFNPSTTLRFGVEKAGRVTIDVFNMAGQKVNTLVDEELTRGYHTVEFNAQELPTGIYFARISAGTFVKTEKMVLLK